MGKPLDGVRVLDMSHVIAGPATGRMLAEHGAQVLHVTPPLEQEGMPVVMDTGFGKRAAYIDLNQVEDVAQLRDLARSADIFIQSWRPGALARRGFSPQDLAAIRPGIIYVSISCYGAEGPWAARGGYGVMRILRLLDENALRANPKVFIGYSDLTALHMYLYRRFGWVTFHGPMAAKDLAGGEQHYDRQNLIAALMQTTPLGDIAPAPHASQLEMLHPGAGPVAGRLLGGCLSLLTAMLGTPDELETRGAILFLEDIGVKPYALDRMFQQLRLAEKLDGVRGIVFGEMADCVQHAEQGYTIQEALAEMTADLGIPVLFGLPSGHSVRGNLTLPLGVEARLDGRNATLTILEAGVSERERD